ncbi:MAG: response regulator transcription factor, partial [Nitrospirae bacterium]|nr:response regulator transcription factor [Nitrospirota bacterium]
MLNHTILVIDDDKDILKVLKANLELHNFNVKTAGSWAEGQKKLSADKIDLLILDLMLPDIDGVEICRTLRKQHPALPIIMLTAKDKISDKVIGLESGADDYVVKPFETLELIARIKACLRRSKQSPEEERITVGDITINYKKRIVHIRGKEIILTPKEYDLLCFLAANRSSVIRREDIKKHLWKESRIYSWSRVIDVHIQHLRQKIEK